MLKNRTSLKSGTTTLVDNQLLSQNIRDSNQPSVVDKVQQLKEMRRNNPSGYLMAIEELKMVADGNGEFTEAMGLTLDATGFGMGMRSQRYAMLVDNGVISRLNVETGPGVEASSAETMMALL